MASNAADTFFWTDWRGDERLRMCSLTARGAWFECLCLMALSDRKGYLLINGRAPSSDELAHAIGTDRATLDKCVDELLRYGVPSMDRNGVLFSRRMIRDSKRRAASTKGGKKGGRVTYEKRKGIFGTQGVTQEATQGATQEGTQDLFYSNSISKKNTESPIPVSPAAPPSRRDVWTALPDWIDRDAWLGFVEMRKAQRWKLTARAVNDIVKKLGALRDAGHDPRAVLDQSTVNCWRGVFEIQNDRRSTPGEQRGGHGRANQRGPSAHEKFLAAAASIIDDADRREDDGG